MIQLAIAALALWGWFGMLISVEVAIPSQEGRAAEAYPTDGYTTCRIVLHPGLDERDYPGMLLHEIGHCVGHYEHSDEPGNIMQNGGHNGRITVTNLLTVKEVRDQRLTFRIIVQRISR